MATSFDINDIGNRDQITTSLPRYLQASEPMDLVTRQMHQSFLNTPGMTIRQAIHEEAFERQEPTHLRMPVIGPQQLFGWENRHIDLNEVYQVHKPDATAMVVENRQPVVEDTLGRTESTPFLRTYEIQPGTQFSYLIPQGLIGEGSILNARAALTDGTPLPGWVRLDLEKGRVYGDAPRGFKGPMEVRLEIRLSNGTTRHMVIKFDGANKPTGKASFDKNLKASRFSNVRFKG